MSARRTGPGSVALATLLVAVLAGCGSSPRPGKGVAVGRSLPHPDAAARAAAAAKLHKAAQDVDAAFALQRPATHSTYAVKAKLELLHAANKMFAAGSVLSAVPHGVYRHGLNKAQEAVSTDSNLMMNAAVCFQQLPKLHHVNPKPCIQPLHLGEVQGSLVRTLHQLSSQQG